MSLVFHCSAYGSPAFARVSALSWFHMWLKGQDRLETSSTYQNPRTATVSGRMVTPVQASAAAVFAALCSWKGDVRITANCSKRSADRPAQRRPQPAGGCEFKCCSQPQNSEKVPSRARADPCCCTQLSRLVAENVLAFDQKFWLRVAARSDTAGSTEEKER